MEFDDEKFLREDAARKAAGMSEKDRADILVKEMDDWHKADLDESVYKPLVKHIHILGVLWCLLIIWWGLS